MKLANRAYVVTLLLLTLVFAVSAQDKDARSAKDDRNTAPTVGTGGPVGGPTGLFTVYDGQTLRKGEFTFSAAWSNFDRDPGNADFSEVPVSFQVGLTNNFELFFNTDAYRGVHVNSPRNLSAFYLPNSQLNINGALRSGPAIILSPQGPGVSQFPNQAVFRPTGFQPFVQFPYIGGSSGTFGLSAPFFSGPVFGFGAGTNAAMGPPTAGGSGADNFPGIGSVYGSILPGVVLQTTPLISATGAPAGEGPLVFSLAPSYLPDAPFINRTWGESSFSTFTIGGKWRFTNINSPVGVGVIGYYRFYADHASDLSGFNQLQRGASPGGNRGDFGAVLFADARLRRWANLSANVGYNYNSSVKADFPNGSFTILDRPDELMASIGIDFPVNKFFQPIAEFRTLQYVGGRTPNAFENHPMDGLIGARVFPARWFGFGFAYRYHFNEQDQNSFDEDDSFTTSVLVTCRPGQTACAPVTLTNTFSGIPTGFTPSSDPHGFILQVFAGRRNKRQAEVINLPANVTNLTVSDESITLPCRPGYQSASGSCNDSTSVSVSTTALDPEGDVLTYNYSVSAGRVVGSGANVSWDLSGQPTGSYTITAGVDDGCGMCGKTMTKTVSIVDCPDCTLICSCPTVSVTAPAGLAPPGGEMTFTANVTGGTGDTAPTYNWTVSEGEIISGQGTSAITVRAPNTAVGGNITASVEVGGFPAGCNCPNKGQDTGQYGGTPPVKKIDEFGKQTDDEVKARVDQFYIQLNNNPTSQGYIINYGTPAEIKRRRAQIMKAINFRKYDASRVTFVDGPDQGTGVFTKFYLVPPDADKGDPLTWP